MTMMPHALYAQAQRQRSLETLNIILFTTSHSKGIEGETYWDNYSVPIESESGDIVNLIQITRNITEQVQGEQALRKREKELKIKTKSLEEANVALRVLLKKRNKDRTELEENVLSNVKELVLPYLEKLKKDRA